MKEHCPCVQDIHIKLSTHGLDWGMHWFYHQRGKNKVGKLILIGKYEQKGSPFFLAQGMFYSPQSACNMFMWAVCRDILPPEKHRSLLLTHHFRHYNNRHFVSIFLIPIQTCSGADRLVGPSSGADSLVGLPHIQCSIRVKSRTAQGKTRPNGAFWICAT